MRVTICLVVVFGILRGCSVAQANGEAAALRSKWTEFLPANPKNSTEIPIFDYYALLSSVVPIDTDWLGYQTTAGPVAVADGAAVTVAVVVVLPRNLLRLIRLRLIPRTPSPV